MYVDLLALIIKSLVISRFPKFIVIVDWLYSVSRIRLYRFKTRWCYKNWVKK